MTSLKDADVYIFDEPSSYLDIKQRLIVSRLIRSLLSHENHIIVAEHDLSILDYISDSICCFYGSQGAYGDVTMPFSVREGINIFLSGFVHTENFRFRQEELNFIDVSKTQIEKKKTTEDDFNLSSLEYPKMSKTMGEFQITVEKGTISNS